MVTNNDKGVSDAGVSAVEYAIIVGIIALAVVAGIGAFGSDLEDFLKDLWTSLGL